MKAWIITLYQFTCLRRTFSIIGTVCAGVALELSFPMVLKIVPLVFSPFPWEWCPLFLQRLVWLPFYAVLLSFLSVSVPVSFCLQVYRIWAIQWTLLWDKSRLGAQSDGWGQGVPPGCAPKCEYYAIKKYNFIHVYVANWIWTSVQGEGSFGFWNNSRVPGKSFTAVRHTNTKNVDCDDCLLSNEKNNGPTMFPMARVPPLQGLVPGRGASRLVRPCFIHSWQCLHGGKPVRDHTLLICWDSCAEEGKHDN